MTSPAEEAAPVHAKLLVESKDPAASTCATCHPKQFKEWSFSQCDSSTSQPNSFAMATHYQIKLDQHSVLIFGAFVGFPDNLATPNGFRTKCLLKF